MGSLFGGSESTEAKIPKWIEQAGKDNLELAGKIGQIGYMPYMGPEVAAFSNSQLAGFQNNNDMARAFGMSTGAGPLSGMPPPQDFGGGIKGYGSYGTYMDTLRDFQKARPAQYQALMDMVMKPTAPAKPAPSPTGPKPAPGKPAPRPGPRGPGPYDMNRR